MPLSFEAIRIRALELGWDDVGITTAEIPEEDIIAYREWIGRGHQAGLDYMLNEIRCFPQQLLPGAKTAILFVSNYKKPKFEKKKHSGLIASYARGRDYHHIHRKRLKKFIQWLEDSCNERGIAKGFSDSTPILEKALAVKAGLGWFGKNTLLIHRRFGTYTLLSGILTTLEIATPSPYLNLRLPKCGVCNRCLQACPTGAIISPYQLDAAKCLSYHLIESKEELPETIKQQNPGYVFGCDICQEVCPHNVRNPLSASIDFQGDESWNELTLEKLEILEKEPERLFGTPLQRRGVLGLKKNLQALLKKS